MRTLLAGAKALAIPEGNVAKITSKTTGELIWEKPSITNWARCSINEDGSIYNNGLGYKIGYRVRSGGAETAATNGVCTGYIPIKIGETLRISPAFAGINTTNAINFCDSGFTNLGQVNDNGSAYGICSNSPSLYKATKVNGMSTLTLTDDHNSNIAYVRITHEIGRTNNGEDLIITINQEILA